MKIKIQWVPALSTLPKYLVLLVVLLPLCLKGPVFQAESTRLILPLSEIKPGMKGTGKTVYSGSRIEEFQVEILGVLENILPRQSAILAKLSGGPLETTGCHGWNERQPRLY